MPARNKRRRKKKSVIFASLICIVALGLMVYGGWGLWQRYRATHNSHPVIVNTVITHSTDTPDETYPDKACAEYKVANDYPERIDIPTIKAGGCIEQVGIDQYGSIAVPSSIYLAAWYINSTLPGQPGLSIIDGHIGGRYNANGIFQKLYQLKKGDTLTIELGSGEILYYQVYNVRSVSLDESINALLVKDQTVKSQLNLITCGGSYSSTTNSYDHRVIISAELL